MIPLVTGLWISAPWLAASLLALSLTPVATHGPRHEIAQRGGALIVAGSSGIASLFLLAGLLLVGITSGAFWEVIAGITLVSAFAIAIALVRLSKRGGVEPSIVMGIFAGVAYSLPLFLMFSEIPLSSWDALNHWAARAKEVGEFHVSGVGAPYLDTHSHPLTLSLLLLWSTAIEQSSWINTTESGFTGLPWFLCAVSLLLMILGWARVNGLSFFLGVLTASIIINTPLVTNHILLYGYSELFLSALLVSSTSLAILSFNQTTPIAYLIASISMALMCIWVRNTGVLFALAMFLALASPRLLSSRKLLTLLLTGCVCLSGLLVNGQDLVFTLRDMSYGLKLSTSEVVLADQKHLLSFPTFKEVLNVFYEGLVRNNTYASVPISVGIAGLFVLCGYQEKTNYTRQSVLLLVLAACLIAIHIFSLSVDHGFRHSLPGQDTFFSRSIMPLVFICFMAGVSSLGYLFVKPKKHSL